MIKPIYSTDRGSLYRGDCLNILPYIKNGSIDCIFSDPPFNLSKKYSSLIDDNKTTKAYLSWTKKWLFLCTSKLKKGGSIYVYNLPRWNIYIANYLMQKGLFFKHWIAIDFKGGMPISGRLYPAHYSLLYFSKGKPKTFNRPKIPVQLCRHCGNLVKDYGGYKNIIEHNGGINLSDIWHDVSPIRHHAKKNHNSNELPEIIIERVLKISTETGDTILDPFGGSGTTYAVAEKMKRKWVGCEIGDCKSI